MVFKKVISKAWFLNFDFFQILKFELIHFSIMFEKGKKETRGSAQIFWIAGSSTGNAWLQFKQQLPRKKTQVIWRLHLEDSEKDILKPSQPAQKLWTEQARIRDIWKVFIALTKQTSISIIWTNYFPVFCKTPNSDKKNNYLGNVTILDWFQGKFGIKNFGRAIFAHSVIVKLNVEKLNVGWMIFLLWNTGGE